MQIFETVDCEIDPFVDKFGFDLFCKQALIADLGQRPVKQLVASCSNDFYLKLIIGKGSLKPIFDKFRLP